MNKLPKFDYVFLLGVVHHLEDQEVKNIFFLIKKILKKSGKIILLDPVYINNQNFIAKFLINNDVGSNVRTKKNYCKLYKIFFKNIRTKIIMQRFIPYTWFFAVCTK